MRREAGAYGQGRTSCWIIFGLLAGALNLLFSAPGEAGTLISERMEWTAQANVDFGAGCQSYPYSFTGPGYLRVRHTMTPALCRRYATTADSICTYDAEGWKTLRSESLYDGKPLPNGGDSCDGTFNVHTTLVEYEIPARTFSGSFSLCSPLKCGWAQCYQRGGAATLEVEFSTTPFKGVPQSGGSGGTVAGGGQSGGNSGKTSAGNAGSSGSATTAGNSAGASGAGSPGGAAGGSVSGGSSSGAVGLPSGTVVTPCPPQTSGMTVAVCSIHAKPGDTVSVPVWLVNGSDLANVNAEISYDASKVQAAGSAGKGGFLGKALFAANTADKGKVRLGFAQSSGVSGTGQMATIPFKVSGSAGQRVPLRVAITTANAPSGSGLSVGAMHGEIIIGGASSSSGSGSGTSGGSAAPIPVAPTPPATTGATAPPKPKLTALDALTALKMSVGLQTADMKYDLDTNKQITSNDARLILLNVVGK